MRFFYVLSTLRYDQCLNSLSDFGVIIEQSSFHSQHLHYLVHKFHTHKIEYSITCMFTYTILYLPLILFQLWWCTSQTIMFTSANMSSITRKPLCFTASWQNTTLPLYCIPNKMGERADKLFWLSEHLALVSYFSHVCYTQYVWWKQGPLVSPPSKWTVLTSWKMMALHPKMCDENKQISDVYLLYVCN